MTCIKDLTNLGPASARMLAAVGIHTLADLERLGVIDAYLMVKRSQPGVSLNLLWAMQGALFGIPWNRLPADMQADLRRQLEDAGG